MLNTSARLLRLLSLLQARGFWSGRELAERLEVTERTVRRDVDRLRELGYPVNATSGVAGGYRLGAGASMPPLLLDDDEALAVALGLRSAAAGTVRGMEAAVVRALAKLEQVLPARLRRRVEALHASVTPLNVLGPPVDPTCLTTLACASRDREQVTLRYGDMHGKRTERVLEPHGLVHSGSRWYLAAWDLGREDWRTFRVDRIDRCSTTGRRFSLRAVPGGSVARYVSQSVSSSAYTFEATLRLHATHEEMAARVSPLSGILEPDGPAHCRFHTGAHSLEQLGLWVGLLGVEFDVLDPPELREHLQRTADRLHRSASAQPRSVAEIPPHKRVR